MLAKYFIVLRIGGFLLLIDLKEATGTIHGDKGAI
jgi:hypothetical protein